ncbi:MAG: transposase [Thermoplasmata archaeon]|uniref:Transposase n=1 Tax=Candidatus Sysuiplasma superficiale TaxID=2823368 RepID=A0A8J7YU96_9ARCH|nr:transposase [Candidatus Sysuiplasma superficiale]
MESYLQGVATRDVRSVVEQLGVGHIAIHSVEDGKGTGYSSAPVP